MSPRFTLSACLWTALIFCRVAMLPAAQDDDDAWIGKLVMVTQNSAELKAGEKTVDTAGLGEVFPVSRVNGPWLWIQDRGGWINRDNVVLLDKAVEHFTNRVQTQRTADAYHQRAVMWISLDQYDEAVADFTAAIERGSKNAELYNARGNVLRKIGKLDQALADFNEVIRQNIRHPAVYTNRGLVWLDKKDYDRALADFTEALRLDTKFAPAWEAGGTAREAQGNYEKAAQNYRKAIDADPNFHPAHNNLAWLLATCPDASLRDGKAAVGFAKKACELTGFQDAGYLDTLAAAHAEAGEFDEAVKRINEAIQLADQKEKAILTERLKLYESKQPYHKSSRTVAPPAP